MNLIKTSPPPLAAGDKLTLKEFLERWEAMPEVQRAELIDGVVYMPSPVGPEHGTVENIVGTWVGNYATATPGCEAGDNTTLVLAGDSPQPDVHLRLLPEVGGRIKVRKKLLHGAPELVAEVCVSSTSHDLNQKLQLYRRNKVYEYVAVLMHEQEIRWHRLVRGRYQLLQPQKDGILRSGQFPGLWLNGPALLAGDRVGVATALQDGLASPEHDEFVQELQRRRSP